MPHTLVIAGMTREVGDLFGPCTAGHVTPCIPDILAAGQSLHGWVCCFGFRVEDFLRIAMERSLGQLDMCVVCLPRRCLGKPRPSSQTDMARKPTTNETNSPPRRAALAVANRSACKVIPTR